MIACSAVLQRLEIISEHLKLSAYFRYCDFYKNDPVWIINCLWKKNFSYVIQKEENFLVILRPNYFWYEN